jgi:hypothetical protein
MRVHCVDALHEAFAWPCLIKQHLKAETCVLLQVPRFADVTLLYPSLHNARGLQLAAGR